MPRLAVEVTVRVICLLGDRRHRGLHLVLHLHRALPGHEVPPAHGAVGVVGGEDVDSPGDVRHGASPAAGGRRWTLAVLVTHLEYITATVARTLEADLVAL